MDYLKVMRSCLFSLFLLLFAFVSASAQDIDVIHYRFHLVLSDTTDRIEGDAFINIQILQPTDVISIDLVEESAGKGMKVNKLKAFALEKLNTLSVQKFEHKDRKLTIWFDEKLRAGKVYILHIGYSGIPADGLIISKNRYGQRTFFSDNWPNRAHHWIPCNDRPDDKAHFEFFVAVPKGYEVISNGVLKTDSFSNVWIEKAKQRGSYFHWEETTPLSTKVMVIGAARFAVKEYEDRPGGVPVSAWVYPEDSVAGFYDYALAPSILEFFSNYIAPYPFKKLANVQSKTIFGGMENASAIFYAESSVTGDRSSEDLLAHEIAHQWFGDMVSEKSFTHLWLSEGFATYLTNIYLEHQYGKEVLNKRLQDDREMVIAFARNSDKAVVDSLTPFMELLNPNSYQKGGWILHMLRQETGDSIFQKILQTFYQEYQGGNAGSKDFEAIAEKVSGTELSWFFDQWLYQPGVPRIEVKSRYEKKKLYLRSILNEFDYYKNLKIDVQVWFEDGTSQTFRMPVRSIVTDILVPDVNSKPVRIVLDPDTKLLFDGKVVMQ